MTTQTQRKAAVRARVQTEHVWREIAEAPFAIISHVTPAGAPRSSGVMYQVIGRRLYVGVDADGCAVVHRATAPEVARIADQLTHLLPTEDQDSTAVLEIVPAREFVTYGIGVSLMQMRDTEGARGRTPV